MLIPPLVVIEIISHIAKIFSLSIRLFANIMAGHILLHILTGFILQLSTIYFEENLGLSKKTYAAIKNINRLKSNYFIINTKFYNEMFFFFNLKKKKLFNA